MAGHLHGYQQSKSRNINCGPNSTINRYVVCFCGSFISAITMFCYDFLVGLQPVLIKAMSITNTQYNLLFSAPTWCDIVTAIVGSVLVNRYIGIRWGIVACLTVSFIGQLLVSLAAFVNSFETMLIGRIIFGFAFGTLGGIGCSYLMKWFENKEVAFAMSINRCISRLACSFALITPILIYNSLDNLIVTNSYQLGATCLVATGFAVVNIGLGVFLALFDKLCDEKVQEKSSKDKSVEKEFRISDIKHFSCSFWIAVVTFSIFYALSYASTANAQGFFINKFEYSIVHANLANSLSYSLIFVISPLIGLCIDCIGYNLAFAFTGSTLMLVSNFMLLTSGPILFTPLLAVGLYSISYSLFGGAMWVGIGLLSPKKQVTTAYGIASSGFSLCFSLIDSLAGIILDYYGYFFLYLFFIFLLMVISGCLILLLVSELSGERVMTKSGKCISKLNRFKVYSQLSLFGCNYTLILILT